MNLQEKQNWGIPSDLIRREAIISEKAGSYPEMSIQTLLRKGLMGVLIPKKWGGKGGNILEMTKIALVLAKDCPSLATIYMFHNQVVKRLLDFGTSEQKEKWLPLLANEWVASSSWSELKAGADKSELNTKAKWKEGKLVLDGSKAFCTGAGFSSLYTVLVRTGNNSGEELTFVLLCKDDNGVLFGADWDGLGLRSTSTREIICDNCLIYPDRILGGIGRGREMMEINRASAIHPGIIGLGIAQNALDILREEIKNKPKIWGFQNTRFILADFYARIQGLELLILEAANLADQRNPRASLLTMQSKLWAAQLCKEVTNEVLQLCGAQGYVRGHKIEKLVRDAMAIGIMGPTTELCKEFIASSWLGGNNE
ncbi:acyl-CoA dehydrogenase family protein [Marininema halotolerans]|uniref:Acyl-CoA dehydrogenase n=1 Tax=Marininema halotolerans TaxID=1155944 RepID=A0A1I6PYT2_9BACL|nr:acyl-CoA dehydrogenase family protein [Marininema halotolerans]SFS45353.1 Acyl-CoA dehydrogenase [Marininema halotolerans]